MPTVLLTGFEPFGGSTLNASAEAVARLVAEPPPDIQLYTEILPVDALRTPELVRGTLLALRPDLCLMLGQAEGRAALSIERVAINLCDFSIPDNGGNQPANEPVVPGGPAAYFATVPVRTMLQAAQAADVPAELSLSAGAYLCNLALYTALHAAAEHRLPTQCGFVHVPMLPSQALGQQQARPTMALETICTGLRAMIGALARAAHSPQRVAG